MLEYHWERMETFTVLEKPSIPFEWGDSKGKFSDCNQFRNDLGPYAGSNTGGWMVAPCLHGLENGDCPTNIHELSFGKTACDWGKKLHAKATAEPV